MRLALHVLSVFLLGGCSPPFDLCPENSPQSIAPICAGLPAPKTNNDWFHHNSSNTVVVFVHGIFGDSRGTWLHIDQNKPEQSAYWPELVKTDPVLEEPSIYLGGFYTDIDSGGFDASNASKELFTAISNFDTSKRRVLDKKNILFITHSTGGIVARHMLYHQRDAFKDKAIGLVLMASPSYGSELADTLNLLAEFYNNKLAKQLQWGSADLVELDRNFQDLVDRRMLPRLIGCEGLENRFIVHWRFLPFFTRDVVVNEQSGARYFDSGTMLGGTDHFSIVKPKALDDRPHAFLRSCYENKFKPLIKDAGKHAREGLTDAEQIVKDLKGKINNVRGDFEALEAYPKTKMDVRQKAAALGEQISNINDDSLNMGWKLTKYEYSLYAYIIGASVEDDRSFRIAYADKGNRFGLEALNIAHRIKVMASGGDKDAATLSKWMADEDVENRCHYLKAVGLAILYRAGGSASVDDVQKEIKQISPHYLELYPVDKNEDLRAVFPKSNHLD